MALADLHTGGSRIFPACGRLAPAEEKVQDADGVREVDVAAAVSIARDPARRRRASLEEVVEAACKRSIELGKGQ